MEQPNAPPPLDLRDLRTTFLDKQIAYALSYAYKLDHIVRGVQGSVQGAPKGLQAHFPKSKEGNEGKVFHVFDDDRVAGLDGNGHDLPKGFNVCQVDETIVLSELPGHPWLSASIDGRLLFEAPRAEGKDKKATEMTDGEPIRISVTYDGALRLNDPFTLGDFPGKAARASAFVVPFFETNHPKYHWLTENVCIAFGTWELDAAGAVTASFDVYSVE